MFLIQVISVVLCFECFVFYFFSCCEFDFLLSVFENVFKWWQEEDDAGTGYLVQPVAQVAEGIVNGDEEDDPEVEEEDEEEENEDGDEDEENDDEVHLPSSSSKRKRDGDDDDDDDDGGGGGEDDSVVHHSKSSKHN